MILAHGLGIQLDEAYTSLANLYPFTRADLGADVVFGQFDSRLYLLSTNSDSGDIAAMMPCQEAGGTANATPHVEHRAAFLKLRAVKQQIDQLGLGLFLGVGVEDEVAMMNMLAPDLVNRLRKFMVRSGTIESSSSPMLAHSDVLYGL